MQTGIPTILLAPQDRLPLQRSTLEVRLSEVFASSNVISA